VVFFHQFACTTPIPLITETPVETDRELDSNSILPAPPGHHHPDELS
jgi:hypothetical protein